MPRDPVKELCVDLTNAYEAHSRSDFDAHLARLRRLFAYTGPVPAAAPAAQPAEGAPPPADPLLTSPAP